CSSTPGNQGLSDQLARTTIALEGRFAPRSIASTASLFLTGFQLHQSSDFSDSRRLSQRTVGRIRFTERVEIECASSPQKRWNPSKDLMESAVWSCRPWKTSSP